MRLSQETNASPLSPRKDLSWSEKEVKARREDFAGAGTCVLTVRSLSLLPVSVQNPDGSVVLKHPTPDSTADPSLPPMDPEERAAAAKRARLTAAFGGLASLSGDAAGGSLSAATERMLSSSVGSAHAHLVQESAASLAATDALYDLMAKKEAMALQLGTSRSRPSRPIGARIRAARRSQRVSAGGLPRKGPPRGARRV